jgi:AGZA family xanthine/uracil permease-like MFS transporter
MRPSPERPAGRAPASPMRVPPRYRWFAAGDVNGFFALAIDNLALLAGMSAILVGIFHLPADLVAGRMLPGSALGVLVGDLAYSGLAIRLARREGRTDVCAMPRGIDTPSMFGLCFGVVGPTWLLTQDPERTLAICSAVVAVMGVVKTVAAFAGDWIRRCVPRAAMLGALSAVAIALITYFSMAKIILEPVGGLVALGVVLSTLIGGRRLPFRLPAMVGAVVLGTLAWTAVRLACGDATPAGSAAPAAAGMHWMMPLPSLRWLDAMAAALPYLPLAIPFALATLIGGIDNTESAAAAGDHYSTRDILLVEGLATVAAAVCGGVMQNTPYIGHPAYKRMGCRAGYTVATALFIGVGASAGVVGLLISWLPESVLVPVLVFVGLELSSQAFRETDHAHLPAIAIAFIPAAADLVLIHWNGLLGALQASADRLPAAQQASYRALTLLANGFILTSMLWSTLVIDIIDRRRARALGVCVLAAVLTVFGVIHSPYADGRLFLPDGSLPRCVPLLAAGYLLLGCVVWGIDRLDPSDR